MSDKNIQMKHYKNGIWNKMYPISLSKNIFNDNGLNMDTQLNSLKDELNTDLLSFKEEVNSNINSILSNAKNYNVKGNANYYNLNNNKFYEDSNFNIESKDDTIKINELLELSGNIYFPKGNYLIDTDISIKPKSNTNIIIHPQANFKVKRTNEGFHRVFLLSQVENVIISGGTIIGDKNYHDGTTGEWGMGISILTSKNIIVENMKIFKCWGDGIYVADHNVEGVSSGKSENVVIKNNILDDNRRQGVSIVFGNNIIVEGNIISNTSGTNPQAGVDVEPNEGGECRNVKVNNNVVFGNQYGIFAYGKNGVVSDLIVSNNSCFDNSRDGLIFKTILQSKIMGNSSRHNGRNNFLIETSKMVNVNSNIINNSEEKGLKIYQCEDLNINNNMFSHNKDTGISMQECKYININNNKITKNLRFGIQMYLDNFYCNIENNNFTLNDREGLALSGSHKNLISGNHFISNGQLLNNAYYNILLANSDDNSIICNSSKMNASTNQPSRAIHIRSDSSNNYLFANDFKNSGISTGILDESTSTVTEPNSI